MARMSDDKLTFYWPSTGKLTIKIRGNDSATLRFKPSAKAIMDAMRKTGVEPAYEASAEDHPHTHGE
jgi:hypothetical protein